MRKCSLAESRVRVIAKFSERGSVLKGTKEGECLGFHVELAVESQESETEIREILRLAHRMCFTEDALSRATSVTYSHSLNGRAIEPGPDA